MDKLACLQAFVTVVETGGFSETARRLQVSKALISKRVAQLEESLGVRLLHRTTRRISPTSSGRAYYEQGKPLLAELNELDDAVMSRDRELRGDLRLSAPGTFAEMHLLPVVSAYAAQNPDVRVLLNLSDRFVDLVEESVDLAVRVGKLESSSLVSRRVGEIHLLVCASPGYIEANGRPESVEALAAHACIVDTNNPDGADWRLTSGRDTRTVSVDGRIHINNARAARDLVLAGNGIGLLTSFVVEAHLRRGELVHLLDGYVSNPVGVYAVYPHRKHLSPKVRRFIDLLVANFEPKIGLQAPG